MEGVEKAKTTPHILNESVATNDTALCEVKDFDRGGSERLFKDTHTGAEQIDRRQISCIAMINNQSLQ
jgi:hypothetical protein